MATQRLLFKRLKEKLGARNTGTQNNILMTSIEVSVYNIIDNTPLWICVHHGCPLAFIATVAIGKVQERFPNGSSNYWQNKDLQMRSTLMKPPLRVVKQRIAMLK